MVQVLLTVVRALFASVTIKHSKVGTRHIWTEVEVLHIFMRIFLVVSASDVLYNRHVKPLHVKLQSAYSESIAWHESMALVIENALE
jgi:hypothetical protein